MSPLPETDDKSANSPLPEIDSKSANDSITNSPEEEKLEIRDDITLNVNVDSSGESDLVSPLDSPRTDETEIKQSRL